MGNAQKERMRQDIINEYEMRTSNNKDAMLDLLEEYTTNFLGIPDGIAVLERDEKQMSYNIFESYICFDYKGSNIEVRYCFKNKEEVYVGNIIFGKVRPLWEVTGKIPVDFNLSTLNQYMENAFAQ